MHYRDPDFNPHYMPSRRMLVTSFAASAALIAATFGLSQHRDANAPVAQQPVATTTVCKPVAEDLLECDSKPVTPKR